MLQLLKNKDYFRFLCAQVISHVGDGITRLAIIYLVATLSKDPLAIGLVIFAHLLPSAVFGIFLGPLADKYSRKWIMVGSDFYRMFIVLVMMLFHDSVPVLISLIVLQGIGTALFDPARSASIPDIVGEDKIQQAISISQGTRAAMEIIGPSIGGLLMVLNNFHIIFSVDAVTFLLSALLLMTLTITRKQDQPSSTNKEGYFTQIRSGIKEVVGIPALRFLLLLLVPVTLVVGMTNTNLISVLTKTFEVSGTHFGFIQSSSGVGAIVGSMILAPFLIKVFRPSSVLIGGTMAIGILMVLIIPVNIVRLQIGIAPVYAWCIMLGILNTLINVPLSSLFLGATPAHFRGRGSALLSATANTFQMIGLLAGGWIAGLIGVLNGTAFSGVLLIAVVIFFPLLKGYKALHTIQSKKAKVQAPSSKTKAKLAVES
ncbi:MFS transporter [Bacillus timonensis]|nr:MFS transporter [Bacillus timonensis]